VVRTKAVIKTGNVSLTGKDLGKVRDEVDDLLAAVGGSVDREQTTNDKQGRIDRSTLVLRVPVEKFDTTKDALERLGKLRSSTEAEKDVSTEVIDTAERVQTLQNSLDRLQRFQRSAKDVSDLIRYEDQITARQSELQSMKAQQTYLADRTSMSTITLRLSTPATYVAPPDALEDAGFLSGLKGGWHALVGFGIVVLTVVGAVLPFAVAFAVLGVPAWIALRALLRRRRTQERGPGPAPTPASP
jgi:Flp pilus assembly protein TadB